MYRTRPRSWTPSSAAGVVVAAFVLGLMLTVPAFTAGVLLERQGVLPGSPPRPPAHLGDTFDPFWEAWDLVEQHYVDRKPVDPARMTAGAIDGMLASLGD